MTRFTIRLELVYAKEKLRMTPRFLASDRVNRVVFSETGKNRGK